MVVLLLFQFQREMLIYLNNFVLKVLPRIVSLLLNLRLVDIQYFIDFPGQPTLCNSLPARVNEWHLFYKWHLCNLKASQEITPSFDFLHFSKFDWIPWFLSYSVFHPLSLFLFTDFPYDGLPVFQFHEVSFSKMRSFSYCSFTVQGHGSSSVLHSPT